MKGESAFPRYLEYKDSGIEWLGELPATWDIMPLKRIASLKSGESINSDSIEDTGEYAVYGGNGLRGYTSRYTHDGIYPLVGRQGALCGNVNYSVGKFWASEHAVVVSPTRRLNTYWLGELLRAMNLNQYSIAAAQPGLSVEAVSNLFVPTPPLPEQQAIASFLDRETAKIDTVIEKQQRLIALLTEKRQAVISHAVTKGLDPNAQMKDSGIEWLGMVPEHWEVTRLGYYATVENGTTPSRDNPEYWFDGDVPWLSSAEVNQYVVTEASEYITEAALKACSLRLLPNESLIVGMIGEGKTRGMSALLKIEATINQNLAGIIPRQSVRSDYLHYAFQTAYLYLREAGRGGNQAAMNCEILRAMMSPIPPIGEQTAIATFLTTETARIDTLIAKANQSIELMKERRSALISAAVTGKIDVRQVA